MSKRSIAVVIGIVFIVVAGGAASYLAKLSADADRERAERAERRQLLSSKLDARHRTLVEHDRRIAQHPFFTPTGEGDAGALFMRHVPWGAGDRAPLLSDDERSAFDSKGGAWLSQSTHPAVARLDLTWLGELSRFGFWDWDAADGPRGKVSFPDSDGPIPNVVELIALAKVRLLQGVVRDDVESAVRDVRHLARLLYSSEHLLGAVGAFAILRHESTFVGDLEKRGLPTDGLPTPLSEADARIARDLVFAASASFLLDPVHPTHGESIAIGRCVGLNEALSVGLAMRPFVQDRYEARYAELSKTVERSGCRLQNVRRELAAPTDRAGLIDAALCAHLFPRTLVNDTRTPDACRLTALIGALPPVRASLGESFLTLFDDIQFARFLEGREDLDAMPSTALAPDEQK